jgi:acyl-CoA synthetase (AMP-forming)/AMP-acid ligase II/1-acyl-sn-glycerol-3-phosphate acyltransferase/acyl carrier protein
MQLLRYLVWVLAKLVLPLRYRVHVHGIERLRDVKGPVLILPNHPGYCDPLLVLMAVWPWLHPRPLLYEDYFLNPLLALFAKLLRAVLVPDLERASTRARQRAGEALAAVVAALRAGDNVILWPAGHIEHDGWERLGGARAAADILQAVPDVQVVLVRTRGIWGSQFSFAFTGSRPPLMRRLAQGIGFLVSNLLICMPRRDVDITVEPIDHARLPQPKRETLNPWLEDWYNVGLPQPPAYVPYHFVFGPRTRDFPRLKGLATGNREQISEETKAIIGQFIEKRLKRSLTEAEQQPDVNFDQLGLDSLDRMEVTLAVEERFGFHGEEVPTTIGQLWELAQGLVEHAPLKPPPPKWDRPAGSDSVKILGETVAEAFLARALANPRDTAVADDLAGVLSYRQLLVGTLTLSRRFAALANPNVGILLPASVACDIAFLALHLSGKLPVLLNWTTGTANLDHAVRLMNVKEVVTSKAFLDRFNVEIPRVRFIFLEDLHDEVGRIEQLATWLAIKFLPRSIRNLAPKIGPDKHALVLFTSGSERAPKAVPLTHANITSEMRAIIDFLGLSRQESILGFLPSFHSFGMVITSIFPILGGLRVVHHPDPADASGLARKIGAYRPTLMVGTPTFVDFIVRRAKPGELSSLKLIVVGAEKCPERLMETCARTIPKAELLEGYGVTECSPVVAGNRPGANRASTVGKPLPGVQVRVVDLENGEELPTGKTGMLWVNGAIVFPGYLGFEGPSPFRDRDGRHWYVTGDLAEIDSDGFIRLVGRLKRFLKAGGEMISLPALEEPLAERFPPIEEKHRVAVEGIETSQGRHIVLFATEPITTSEANAILEHAGLRGVLRLDEVRRVEQIPLLGTGKIDYKVLRAQLETEQSRLQPANQ